MSPVQSQTGPELVTTTVRDYDLEQTNQASRGVYIVSAASPSGLLPVIGYLLSAFLLSPAPSCGASLSSCAGGRRGGGVPDLSNPCLPFPQFPPPLHEIHSACSSPLQERLLPILRHAADVLPLQLFIQSVMALKAMYDSKIFKLHVLGQAPVGDLKRPFAAAPSMMDAFTGGAGATEPATIKEVRVE